MQFLLTHIQVAINFSFIERPRVSSLQECIYITKALALGVLARDEVQDQTIAEYVKFEGHMVLWFFSSFDWRLALAQMQHAFLVTHSCRC